jgi:hypothetical protein
VLQNFSGAAQVDISAALLAQQQGNGNSVFNIGLDAAQAAVYDAIIAANGAANVFVGLRASFGCGSTGPSVCDTGTLNFSSTDGAESFLAFNPQTAAVPGPVVGAGLPGLVAALLGMLGINRLRRKRRTA